MAGENVQGLRASWRPALPVSSIVLVMSRASLEMRRFRLASDRAGWSKNSGRAAKLPPDSAAT